MPNDLFELMFKYRNKKEIPKKIWLKILLLNRFWYKSEHELGFKQMH
jgi:hypothetical protein